jgi:hypothetical protein
MEPEDLERFDAQQEEDMLARRGVYHVRVETMQGTADVRVVGFAAAKVVAAQHAGAHIIYAGLSEDYL